jgi:hypothetical protein
MAQNVVDLLDEDKPIAQQKFVCVSFVSPENHIKAKQEFFFEKFVSSWDIEKSMEKFSQFTAFVSFKYNLDPVKLNEDLVEFCKEEGPSVTSGSTIANDYKSFLDKNEETLNERYSEEHSFQTAVRGLKVRGTFPTQKEAEFRAKVLRESDPNFDVFVGPVGVWMPWDPDAYKTGRVEHLEKELNDLMHKKKDNEEAAKDHFEERVRESKRKAMEENKAKALETGNRLTQTLSESGDLVAIKNTNSQLTELESSGDVSESSIKKMLFENENVVIPKK